jgi:hypothetical protein
MKEETQRLGALTKVTQPVCWRLTMSSLTIWPSTRMPPPPPPEAKGGGLVKSPRCFSPPPVLSLPLVHVVRVAVLQHPQWVPCSVDASGCWEVRSTEDSQFHFVAFLIVVNLQVYLPDTKAAPRTATTLFLYRASSDLCSVGSTLDSCSVWAESHPLL